MREKIIYQTKVFFDSLAGSVRQFKPIHLLFWIPGLYYVFSRLIPCHSTDDYYSYQPVDDAWSLVLHLAHEKHWQFGRDIVFTYGPWGFLGRGYYPSTYPVCVASWLALALVFVWAGWRLARSFTNNPGIAWLWLIGFTALATIPLGSDFGNRVTAWGVLLLFLHFFAEEVRFSLLPVVLAFTLGWLGLIKFNGLMEGGFLVSMIAADTIIRWRRFPWVFLAWLGGIVFFWLLAGQQLAWFWPFLKDSWELADGYSDAMEVGRLFDPAPLVYCLIAAGFCGLILRLMRPKQRVGGTFLLAGLGGILFLTFKQSFVRIDYTHRMCAATALLVVALACLAVACTRECRALIAAWILGCACLWFTSFVPIRGQPESRIYRQILETFSAESLLAPVVSLTTPGLKQSLEKQFARLRMETPLPPGSGKADLYPYRQDILFANGIEYEPRPVIQSYSAYTSRLDRLNADWLRTDAAAQTVYFTVASIDYRLPSLDDGLSWPELLTRYDVQGIEDHSWKYLYLTRSPHPRNYELSPLQQTTINAEKPYELPQTNGLIWAQMDFRKTLAGKLLSFFYKPPILAVNLRVADGTSYVFNVVPQLASAGFLLSPMVPDNATFLALAKGDAEALSAKKVISMTVFERGTTEAFFCYQPEIKIKLYRLDFPAQNSESDSLRRR